MDSKIFLLNGSANERGNTYDMLQTLQSNLPGQATAEIVHVASLLEDVDPPYCAHCSDPCAGDCYRGTELEDVYAEMRRADAIVAGSPVYFGTVSTQLKGFWDKTRRLRSESGLLYTVGAALSVGGGRFGGQETVLSAVHDMMLIHGMIIVGDSSPDGIGHQGSCAARPASGDASAAQSLARLAEGVADVAEASSSLRRKCRKNC